MRSSTSDSDRPSHGAPSSARAAAAGSGAFRASIALVAGCALVALGVEAVARVGFDRASKIQRRMASEYNLARTIGGDCDRRHVLLVGNSLLDEDVQFDALRAAVGSGWDARRFVVEQTFYLDWYYGLRRLFHEGARPDVVVVMLATGHWTRNESRGDYSAHYLVDLADVPAAARDLRLNPTQTASFALSNVSKFWAARAEIRNFVLGHLMPDLGQLMDYSSVVDTHPAVESDVARVARDRIARMKALAAANGAELVIVVPAVLNANDGAEGILRAAAATDTPALRPVVSGTLGKTLYRDAGFHLNATGAAAFTARLIPVLQRQLDGARPSSAPIARRAADGVRSADAASTP
jgi:hypothetical protein